LEAGENVVLTFPAENNDRSQWGGSHGEKPRRDSGRNPEILWAKGFSDDGKAGARGWGIFGGGAKSAIDFIDPGEERPFM
jgi:hypothetical protein